VEVDASLWVCGWPKFLTFSKIRKPGTRYLSPDGTFKMRIRFVQFGGILECKKEKDEELKGLKDRTGDTILRNVGTLLDSHDLSDLKIKTSDGKVFQAHKLILAGSFCIFFISHHSHHNRFCTILYRFAARSPVFLV
jgi:hypothetical protein